MSENHIQKQIDLITKHEEDFLARRTSAERVGDAVATFVGKSALCQHSVAHLRRMGDVEHGFDSPSWPF